MDWGAAVDALTVQIIPSVHFTRKTTNLILTKFIENSINIYEPIRFI
jgi:hypothetical protein